MQEFLESLLTVLRNMSDYTGPSVAVCAFLAYIVKPVRAKIAKVIKRISNSEEINRHIEEISAKADALLKHDEKRERQMNLHEKIHLSALKNRIVNLYFKYINSEYLPSFEKQNLAEQYGLYKELGGNGYLDALYESLMSKEAK